MTVSRRSGVEVVGDGGELFECGLEVFDDGGGEDVRRGEGIGAREACGRNYSARSMHAYMVTYPSRIGAVKACWQHHGGDTSELPVGATKDAHAE